MTALSRALGKYRSKREAAKCWGLSKSYVCEVANGSAKLSANAAVLIETATRVPALELLSEQSEREIKALKALQASADRRT